jgi:hypothetical protein
MATKKQLQPPESRRTVLATPLRDYGFGDYGWLELNEEVTNGGRLASCFCQPLALAVGMHRTIVDFLSWQQTD